MKKIDLVRKLREETGMGLHEVSKALDETDFDYDKAKDLLMSRGSNRIRDREPTAGRVETYNHGSRIGVVVEVNCNTDYTARTDGFITLCHEIAMQIAAMNPYDVEALMASEYIRDSRQTIQDMVTVLAVACNENIVVSRFSRFELNGPDKQMAPLVKPVPYNPDGYAAMALPVETASS